LSQFLGLDPGQGSAAQRSRFVSQPFAPKEAQENCFLRVNVSDRINLLADGHFDAEFLQQLTLQAALEGFGRLAFAAGKLP
jgi:hypothetical protein